MMRATSLVLSLTALLGFTTTISASGPFFLPINGTGYMIGNDIWNITIGDQYGTKLFYKNKDLVGSAVGHYVSYNGAASDLDWTSAAIYKNTSEYMDISFTSVAGDLHWVIYPELAGAYQYFVNRGLPLLGEFRTLVRLDNTTFLYGKTDIKDELLPTLADIANSTKAQDETWLRPDGTYITKYDFAAFIRNSTYHGVYGPSFGSWYIVPGKDDYNGNHLKQELMVHRESATGDVVQLNMLHGTHFQALSSDVFAANKTWGPWLWYLNNGSIPDVESRAVAEAAAYPYAWFGDAAYQARGDVKGVLRLSDGRAAAGAAVFLGDNYPNETALDMGRYNYYTTYADADGCFVFTNVKASTYGLQAWSNGSPIGDVSTTFLLNDVSVSASDTSDLGTLEWTTQDRELIFQIGDMDRKSLGFQYGGAPHQHALVASCPANLTFIPGISQTSDWCFGQSALGTWTVAFNLTTPPFPSNSTAGVLSVSLAGYSSGSSSNILVNGVQVGNLTSASILTDPSLYRSGTTAGEWHYYEFPVKSGLLMAGLNNVQFVMTRFTLWHGMMWDSVLLEWA